MIFCCVVKSDVNYKLYVFSCGATIIGTLSLYCETCFFSMFYLICECKIIGVLYYRTSFFGYLIVVNVIFHVFSKLIILSYISIQLLFFFVSDVSILEFNIYFFFQGFKFLFPSSNFSIYFTVLILFYTKYLYCHFFPQLIILVYGSIQLVLFFVSQLLIISNTCIVIFFKDLTFASQVAISEFILQCFSFFVY